MGFGFLGVAFTKVPLSQVNGKPGKGQNISAIDQNSEAQIKDNFAITADAKSDVNAVPSKYNIKESNDVTRSMKTATKLGQNDPAMTNKFSANYLSQARAYLMSTNHTPEETASFRDLSRAYIRYVQQRQIFASKGIDKVEQEPKSKHNELLVNEFYQEELTIQQALLEAKSLMERSGYSKDVLDEFSDSLSASFTLSAKIEEVAAKNGYQLYANNEEAEILNSYLLNDAAGAATGDLGLLSMIQDSMGSIVKEVMDMIVKNNTEQGKLDEEASKQLLSKKQSELKDIDRKMIKKLVSKNLMNKINAEKAELLYLLKDLTRMSGKRLAGILNAISKIKVVLEKTISISK